MTSGRTPRGAQPLLDQLVRCALVRVGLTRSGPVRVLPVAPGRPRSVVLEVRARDRHEHERPRMVVVKAAVSPTPAEARSLEWEHTVGAGLHAVARELHAQRQIPHVPVPAVLHPMPFEVGLGDAVRASGLARRALLSVRECIDATGALTPHDWGRLVAALHLIGASPEAIALVEGRPSNVLLGLDGDALRRAVQEPGHPHEGDVELVRRLTGEIDRTFVLATKADPESATVLVHRDLHPGNVVDGPVGPVAIDWAEAGLGSRAEDFAWLQVAVARFGAPASVLEAARRGYEEIAPGRCPTSEQIRGFGLVRQLVCLAYSVQKAALSAAHRREALLQLPVLDDPDAVTPDWTPLFNPAAFVHPFFGRPGVVPVQRPPDVSDRRVS